MVDRSSPGLSRSPRAGTRPAAARPHAVIVERELLDADHLLNIGYVAISINFETPSSRAMCQYAELRDSVEYGLVSRGRAKLPALNEVCGGADGAIRRRDSRWKSVY